jgi:ribonuclease E
VVPTGALRACRAGDVAAFDAALDADAQPATEPTLAHHGAEFAPPHEHPAEQPRTAAFDDSGFEPAPAAQDWQPPEPAPPAAIWSPPEPRTQQMQPPESVQPEPEPVAVEPTPSSRRRSTVREPVAPVSFDDTSHTPPAPIPMPVPPAEPAAVGSEPEDSARPRRSGWWSRRVFGKG